jgi:prephenate dehydrogenase
MKIVVIGAGLIGTSIALGAKRAGAEVELFDADGRAQDLANDLVNSSKIEDPTIVVIATPTSAVNGVLNRYKTLYPKSTFIDIGSTKTKVKVDVQTDSSLASRFCPTHPMAGRELDGAEAAQSDLFVGKSWIITPLAETSGESIVLVKELIEKLGARVIAMSPEDHDAAVASVSHLPQIISSLLAAQLESKSSEYLALAGTGVLDTTRIAGSNPDLWREILNLNKEALMPLLKDFQKDLSTLIDSYDVQSVLERERASSSAR